MWDFKVLIVKQQPNIINFSIIKSIHSYIFFYEKGFPINGQKLELV